ncbi:hypothetical protein Tco_0753704 [Tanacetum coccineum]
MVAYLQKPEGSEAFHQIVDFLNASHIKYALIENPKIYISLIQQFWGTATARTTDDGEVEITASIDGQVKTITEASLRRHLKLEDSDGITSLPNTEIFEQLALMGYFPTQTQVADEAAFTSVDVDVRGAATTDIGLEAGQGSGTMHKTPTRPHDVHTLGSDEDSQQQNELMNLVTKLIDRVEVLENDMQQTKKVYSSALTKLILRVKKLEKKVKTNKARRRARIVILEDEDAEEDSSKQGRKISEIDKDPTISLVQPEQDMEYDFDVSTAEGFTTASVPVTTASATPEKKTKKQLEQERLGHEEAIRLQEQINEEERQRIARDAEIAKQLQEEFDRARQEQEVVAEADQAHDIDWSDPAVLRYHAVQNRSFSKAESSKKRSREDSDEDDAKKQKLEDDAEKKELRDNMDVVPRDDITIDVESLATKYPIVDWKTHVLTENMMYYQIIRGDGSSKNYKIFSEMLDDFDRMLSRRLEVDQESEMTFELLRDEKREEKRERRKKGRRRERGWKERGGKGGGGKKRKEKMEDEEGMKVEKGERNERKVKLRTRGKRSRRGVEKGKENKEKRKGGEKGKKFEEGGARERKKGKRGEEEREVKRGKRKQGGKGKGKLQHLIPIIDK